MNRLAVLDNTNRKTCRSAIRTGKLVVNLDSRIVSVDDRAVQLWGKEYGLLELLSQHKGMVVTKVMLLEHLYGWAKGTHAQDHRCLCLPPTQKTRPGDRRKSLYRDGMGRGYVLREPILTAGTTTPVASMPDADARWRGQESSVQLLGPARRSVFFAQPLQRSGPPR